ARPLRVGGKGPDVQGAKVAGGERGTRDEDVVEAEGEVGGGVGKTRPAVGRVGDHENEPVEGGYVDVALRPGGYVCRALVTDALRIVCFDIIDVAERRDGDTGSGLRSELGLPGLAAVAGDGDQDVAAARGVRDAGRLACRVKARPDHVKAAV